MQRSALLPSRTALRTPFGIRVPRFTDRRVVTRPVAFKFLKDLGFSKPSWFRQKSTEVHAHHPAPACKEVSTSERGCWAPREAVAAVFLSKHRLGLCGGLLAAGRNLGVEAIQRSLTPFAGLHLQYLAWTGPAPNPADSPVLTAPAVKSCRTNQQTWEASPARAGAARTAGRRRQVLSAVEVDAPIWGSSPLLNMLLFCRAVIHVGFWSINLDNSLCGTARAGASQERKISKAGYDITPMTLQEQQEAAKGLTPFQRCAKHGCFVCVVASSTLTFRAYPAADVASVSSDGGSSGLVR